MVHEQKTINTVIFFSVALNSYRQHTLNYIKQPHVKEKNDKLKAVTQQVVVSFNKLLLHVTKKKSSLSLTMWAGGRTSSLESACDKMLAPKLRQKCHEMKEFQLSFVSCYQGGLQIQISLPVARCRHQTAGQDSLKAQNGLCNVYHHIYKITTNSQWWVVYI